MLNLLFQPFKQCFDFSGRATRMQYWMFLISWTLIAYIFIFVIDETRSLVHSKNISGIVALISIIIIIFFFITQLSLTIRRLHDTNRSGWWWFIQIIPLIGTIWMFVLMCLGSTEGENDYGPEVNQ